MPACLAWRAKPLFPAHFRQRNIMSVEDKLLPHREAIDAIDAEILELLNRRAGHAQGQSDVIERSQVVEELEVLEYDADLTPKQSRVDLADIHTIDQDASRFWGIETL